jgi:hypothetical protein
MAKKRIPRQHGEVSVVLSIFFQKGSLPILDKKGTLAKINKKHYVNLNHYDVCRIQNFHYDLSPTTNLTAKIGKSLIIQQKKSSFLTNLIFFSYLCRQEILFAKLFLL